ncbi:hypothetical protein JVU11DRAFT_463 [Chiua virens]|nr:hypothetical protein JVU11DRAFT_463 [Chiua virens]
MNKLIGLQITKESNEVEKTTTMVTGSAENSTMACGYDAQSYDEPAYDSSYGQPNSSRHGDSATDYTDDRHGKGFHPKKRMVPSEPSSHVIFLGLDPDFSEADLQAYLSSHGCNIETVTIIRDRSSGISKGFGFAQFASVEHARAFVDPLFPFVQVPPPASHGASAKATFYKALETGTPHNGRRVKIDYSQSALPHDKGRRQNMNDGTRDIGNAPAAVLLFRGLDPLSGPQAIAQAMMGSAGPGKDGHKGMKRIVLIKDKVTLASFQFAFVEFVDIQSASAVLANTMSAQIHPSGFRISDKPVAASFAHPYSFQAVSDYMLRDETAIPSSLNLGGVEDTFVKYWDESATVAVLEFKVDEPAITQAPATATVAAKEKEKKRKAKDESAKKPPAPSVLPISDKPVTLNFKAGATGGKPVLLHSATKAAASLPLGFSAEEFDPGDDEMGPEPTADDEKATAARKVAPLIASKKTANNIQKWNQVQEELKEGPTAVPRIQIGTPSTEATSAHLLTSQVPISQLSATSTATTPEPVETDFEFSDLKRHNKESDLHKASLFTLFTTYSEKNFKDMNLREVARQKVEATRKTSAPKAAENEQPKYRDRASERRIMHNQPDVPLPENTTTASKKKRFTEGTTYHPLLRLQPPQPQGKMRITQTAIYAQGVGLGASKAKELGKYAEGYSGYVHMAQDAARERYGS